MLAPPSMRPPPTPLSSWLVLRGLGRPDACCHQVCGPPHPPFPALVQAWGGR